MSRTLQDGKVTFLPLEVIAEWGHELVVYLKF